MILAENEDWDYLKPKIKVTDFWRRLTGYQNNITADSWTTGAWAAWVHLYMIFFLFALLLFNFLKDHTKAGKRKEYVNYPHQNLVWGRTKNYLNKLMAGANCINWDWPYPADPAAWVSHTDEHHQSTAGTSKLLFHKAATEAHCLDMILMLLWSFLVFSQLLPLNSSRTTL